MEPLTIRSGETAVPEIVIELHKALNRRIIKRNPDFKTWEVFRPIGQPPALQTNWKAGGKTICLGFYSRPEGWRVTVIVHHTTRLTQELGPHDRHDVWPTAPNFLEELRQLLGKLKTAF